MQIEKKKGPRITSHKSNLKKKRKRKKHCMLIKCSFSRLFSSIRTYSKRIKRERFHALILFFYTKRNGCREKVCIPLRPLVKKRKKYLTFVYRL